MDEITRILSAIRPDVDFTASDRLIDDGLLDSFDVITAVADISEAFGVEINAGHLVPENFNSVAAIHGLVTRLKGKA
ncbi:MAG: acyl carrier protein [Oscillospiraceae bacterium]|nr:acyl carrier protein [Oscillospiraceae bacterium]